MTETKDSRNNQGCGFAGACGVPHSSGEERKRGELLAAIESPADLRKLPLEALPAVCADIRDFLIDSLSGNPGHFASSMGAVELTVALHYVFSTPYDRIVWDVGHQAYGHKLLTGRRDRFHSNRKMGGLSGFPNPDESEYDSFMAGHASNSISAALGMAVATELNAEEPRRNVVAVIGDASISGGLAFEGINNAANTPNNLLIILNDNNMSIDPNVGSLHSYLARITTSKGYNDMRYSVYRVLRKLNLVSDRRKGAIMRLNNSLKSFISHEQNIFEGLNIRYFGPIDGHDVGAIVKVLNDIKDMKGPRILHIKTQKGKGFGPAEKDPSTWHAPGKFNPRTGELQCSNPGLPAPPKFQEVAGSTLVELADKNPNVVGITAGMLSGTSMSILKSAHPSRVFDIAYLRTIPGMTIASPRNEMMLRNLLFTAQSADCGPFAIRYPRGAGENTEWRNEPVALEIGRGERLRDGKDVAVISTGPIASEVEKALKETEAAGISAAHYDMTFIKPIDEALLKEIAAKGCPVLTVEDGTIIGGLGSAVIEWMSGHGYTQVVERIGVPDRFVAQGTVAQLRALCGMDAQSIAAVITRLAKGGGSVCQSEQHSVSVS